MFFIIILLSIAILNQPTLIWAHLNTSETGWVNIGQRRGSTPRLSPPHVHISHFSSLSCVIPSLPEFTNSLCHCLSQFQMLLCYSSRLKAATIPSQWNSKKEDIMGINLIRLRLLKKNLLDFPLHSKLNLVVGWLIFSRHIWNGVSLIGGHCNAAGEKTLWLAPAQRCVWG